MEAVEKHATDGPALVKLIRGRARTSRPKPIDTALIEAARCDLTDFSLVADASAPWSSEFTPDDREAAEGRLSRIRDDLEIAEASCRDKDHKLADKISDGCVAKGKLPLTDEYRQGRVDHGADRRSSTKAIDALRDRLDMPPWVYCREPESDSLADLLESGSKDDGLNEDK